MIRESRTYVFCFSHSVKRAEEKDTEEKMLIGRREGGRDGERELLG